MPSNSTSSRRRQMMRLALGASLAAGSVAAMSGAAVATDADGLANPPAMSKAQGIQLAACGAQKACNPCAAKKGCNPCAAKKACNPCNPCAAKKN